MNIHVADTWWAKIYMVGFCCFCFVLWVLFVVFVFVLSYALGDEDVAYS